MKKNILRVELSQGELKIFPYGVAYWDISRNVAVCYPIPFNLLIGVLRNLYHAISDGLSPTRFDKHMQIAKNEGYKAGWDAAMERSAWGGKQEQ